MDEQQEQRCRADRAESIAEYVLLRVPFVALRAEERRPRLAATYGFTTKSLIFATAGASDSRAPLRQATTSVYSPGAGGAGNMQSIVWLSLRSTVAVATI